MQKGERLAGDLASVQQMFAGSNSPLAEMRQAARRLDRIAAEHPCWKPRSPRWTAR
jgi:DNA repair protein RecN (Recombination protein N)